MVKSILLIITLLFSSNNLAVEVSTASLNVTWVAPDQREDNTELSSDEIAGYKIYYGISQGNYTNSATNSDSSATGYVINDLAAGTYYIAVTTIDTDGRESRYSDEIIKSIDPIAPPNTVKEFTPEQGLII